MADDEDQPQGENPFDQLNTSTGGGSAGVTPKNPFDQFDQPTRQEAKNPFDQFDKPQEDPSLLGSVGRTLARSAAPVTAGIIGGAGGAELGAAAGAAIGSIVPGVGTVIGAGIGGIGGAVLGGIAGGAAARGVQDPITDTLGLDSPESRERDVKAHPYATTAAELGTAALSLSPGNLSTSIATRLASGAALGGFDVINQGISKGFSNIDPTEAAISAGVGAALPKLRPWAEGAAGAALRGVGVSRTAGEAGAQAGAATAADQGITKVDNGVAPDVAEVFAQKQAPGPSIAANEGPAAQREEAFPPRGYEPGPQAEPGPPSGLEQGEFGYEPPRAPPPPAFTPEPPGRSMGEFQPPGNEGERTNYLPSEIQQTPDLTPEQIEQRRAALAATPAPPMRSERGNILAPQARDIAEAPRAPTPAGFIPEDLSIPASMRRAPEIPNEELVPGKIGGREAVGQNKNETYVDPKTGVTWENDPRVGWAERRVMTEVTPTPADEAAIAEMRRPQSLSGAATEPGGLEGPEPPAAVKLKNSSSWQRANNAFDSAFKVPQMLVAPGTVSDLGRQADKIVSAHFGQDTKALAQHQQGLDAIQTYFDRLTPEQRHSALDYELGNVDQAHPASHYMNEAHEISNKLDQNMKAVGAEGTYNRASLPSFFDPAQKVKLADDIVQFHQDNNRYPTLGELVKAGYRLKDDLVMADGSPNVNNIVQQQNFMKNKNIHVDGILKDMIEGKPAEPGIGALEPLLRQRPETGLVPIDKSITHDVQYYGAPEVKRVVETYLNPEIRDPTIRSAYESYMKLKSLSTQATLLGGIYHFRFMTLEAPINEINAGMQRILKNPVEGLKDIAKAPFAAYTLYKQGKNAIYDGIMHPDKVKDPYMRVANELAAEGGEAPVRVRGFGVTPELETGAVKGLASAWKPAFQQYQRDLVQRSLKVGNQLKEGNYGAAAKDASLGALKTLSEAMQLVMHPLFNHYIPLLKAGANRANIIRFLADNPGLTHDQYVEMARRFVRQTDNAMGELNQSTIYAPAYVKAIGNATMVSPGWNIGAGKTFIGGARAFVRNPKAMFTGPDLDPRIGYIPAFVAATALYNIGAQLLHGQGPPQDLTDVAFPRTGGKTKKGNPEREIQPGYEKDVQEAAHILGGPEPTGPAFAKYMNNKLEGLPRSLIDTFIFNQNFAGKQIANPNDPFYKRLGDYVGYVTKNAMVPIAVQQMMHEEKNKGTNIGPVEKFLGNRHAPEYWQDPKQYQARIKKEAAKEAKAAKTFHQKTGYAEGGSVTGQEADQGNPYAVTPKTPGQWSDEDEARLQATNTKIGQTAATRGLNYAVHNLGKTVRDWMGSAQAAPTDQGYDDGGTVGQTNFDQANKDMNLSQQEQNIYQEHLANLNNPKGGIDNPPGTEMGGPEGSRSSLYQMSYGDKGLTHNIPTVANGQFLSPDDAITRANQGGRGGTEATSLGINTYPSYPAEANAEQRYDQMHSYMDKDTGAYMARQNTGSDAAKNDTYAKGGPVKFFRRS